MASDDTTPSGTRAKDELLSMLGHELRNPLNAIATAVEVLNRTDSASPRAVRAREIIEHQVTRLTAMTNRLLDVGRLVADDIALVRLPVDLAWIARHAVATVVPAAVANAQTLETALTEGAWVRGDAKRLEEIVGNLLDNAIRHTPPGTTIRLTVDTEDGWVRTTVRDDGPGLPPAVRDRLYEPFVQGPRGLDRRAGGLGVGLAIVRRLVALHEGALQVESSDTGTIATVTLPAVPRDVAILPPVTGRRRVVVIDDNRDALDGLRSLLELEGHVVSTASDGTEGLAAIEREQPDAAIVDIGLPGVDGYEVARRSRGAGYRGLLIALTGYGQQRDQRDSMAAGFDEHMVKPAVPAELARVLARST